MGSTCEDDLCKIDGKVERKEQKQGKITLFFSSSAGKTCATVDSTADCVSSATCESKDDDIDGEVCKANGK